MKSKRNLKYIISGKTQNINCEPKFFVFAEKKYAFFLNEILAATQV